MSWWFQDSFEWHVIRKPFPLPTSNYPNPPQTVFYSYPFEWIIHCERCLIKIRPLSVNRNDGRFFLLKWKKDTWKESTFSPNPHQTRYFNWQSLLHCLSVWSCLCEPVPTQIKVRELPLPRQRWSVVPILRIHSWGNFKMRTQKKQQQTAQIKIASAGNFEKHNPFPAVLYSAVSTILSPQVSRKKEN